MEKVCRIVVIDGQGGGIGRMLVEEIKKRLPNAIVTAVGTNGAATAAMMKGGADEAATGENAVVTASRNADFIAGPVGIISADAMIGEVTKKMAVAVGRSAAKKILIPVNRCQIAVAGVRGGGPAEFVAEAVSLMKQEFDCGKG